MLALTLMACGHTRAIHAFFLVPLLRELLDMGAEPYFAGLTTPKGLGSLMVFLVVFVIPALLALPKLRTVATTIECGGG